VIPSLILLWYFQSRDKYPEPAWLVWTTSGLGMLANFPASQKLHHVAWTDKRQGKTSAEKSIVGLLQLS
jgi:RsiW-degrading membrane proteinase PrsW (M82 family)